MIAATSLAIAGIGDHLNGKALAKVQEAEAYAEQVERIHIDHYTARLTALSHDDLISGMHSATQHVDGAPLRDAFLTSDEKLGATVRRIILRELSVDTEMTAHAEEEQLESDARRDSYDGDPYGWRRDSARDDRDINGSQS